MSTKLTWLYNSLESILTIPEVIFLKRILIRQTLTTEEQPLTFNPAVKGSENYAFEK